MSDMPKKNTHFSLEASNKTNQTNSKTASREHPQEAVMNPIHPPSDIPVWVIFGSDGRNGLFSDDRIIDKS